MTRPSKIMYVKIQNKEGETPVPGVMGEEQWEATELLSTGSVGERSPCARHRCQELALHCTICIVPATLWGRTTAIVQTKKPRLRKTTWLAQARPHSPITAVVRTFYISPLSDRLCAHGSYSP